jgi:hypothetical protein
VRQGDETLEAVVVDFSPDGLALKWDRPVATGSTLEVKQLAADSPWLLLEVRHCQPKDEAWIVGAQVVGTHLPR